MPYKKEELLALPDEEKMVLAQTLWNSIQSNKGEDIEEEILFVEERLKMHEANPGESMNWEELRNRLETKHGF